MSKKYNITVIGTGVLALSIAGQMAVHGDKVTFVDTKTEKDMLNRLNNSKKLIFTGEVNYESEIAEFTSDYHSLEWADVIAVAASPSDFSNVFDRMLPKIKEGQLIIFFPGCFGAMLLKNRIERQRQIKEIFLSESVSYPYVTELKDFNIINVHSIKKELKLASCPQIKNEELCQFYNTFFNIFVCAQSFLETSLENINSVLHPLPILLNIGLVEKENKSFKHFIDGVTPIIGSLMDQMDTERLAVGNAYGLRLSPSLDQLNCYYGQSNAHNLYEYLAGKDSPYKNISGFGLESRYITEDIPYLAVPLASLGKAAKVKTPLFDIAINLAGQIRKEDFKYKGFSINCLGLKGKSVEKIQQSLYDFQVNA